MSFLSPTSLIWFVPLGGIIVLLYLLKLRRREHLVSSVMLWQDAVADIQANAPFQRLKKSLLLILQLVALLLLVVALARPYVTAKGISENRIVLIFDSSASMQSSDVSPSRFEAAKSRALAIVKRMGVGDTMVAITAGAKTRVVTSFTSDKRALSSVISRLQPVDTDCNMRQALVLALSLAGGKSAAPPRIVIFSDGGFNDLSDIPASGARIDYVRIGRRCDNVAITGLDSRRSLSGGQQVFIGLRNFSSATRRFNLEIYARNQLIDIRDESLGAGEAKQEILDDSGAIDGRVTAKIDVSDDLAADDSGSVYLARRREMSVLLVSTGNVFLQNALNLDPRTRVTTASSAPADLGKRGYDLVVFDGVAPPKSLPAGGYLLIKTSAAGGPAASGKPMSRPTVVDVAKHPVTAYVDFSGVRMAKATPLSVRPWAASLVEAEGGAVVAAGTDSGRRFVQLGFSLLESDFPLHVGFPIFITNCLEWLVPEQKSGGESVSSGRPVYIDVPAGLRQVEITDPAGARQRVRVTQTPMIFDDTDRVGVYRVTGKGFAREFACNLASAQESGTRPRDAVIVAGRQLASSGRAVRTNRELYSIALILVLAVLTFEWYAYHRRL